MRLSDIPSVYTNQPLPSLFPLFPIQCQIMGTPELNCAVKTIEHYGLDLTTEQFMHKMDEAAETILVDAEWMPGAMKLVHHLKKVDIHFLSTIA